MMTFYGTLKPERYFGRLINSCRLTHPQRNKEPITNTMHFIAPSYGILYVDAWLLMNHITSGVIQNTNSSHCYGRKIWPTKKDKIVS